MPGTHSVVTALGRPVQRMVFLVFGGMLVSEVLGPAETLAEAARLGAPYDVSFASPDGQDVVAAHGVVVPVRSRSSDLGTVDTIFVPGRRPPRSDQAAPAAARELLGRNVRAGRWVGIGTGAFTLGEAGLLDGRRSTTQWRYAPTLAARFPRTTVEPSDAVVQDGNIFTAATPSAAIQLAVALVEQDHGRDLAAGVRAALGAQSPVGLEATALPSSGRRNGTSRILLKVLALIQADPGAPHTVSSLSRAASVSTRHLTRLFREELQTTPAQYVEQVRFSLARRFLDQRYSVTETAMRSGYGSSESLRRAFNAHLGEPPSRYRLRRSQAQADSNQAAADEGRNAG